MKSPVIVENCANFAMPVPQETGFPFDDSNDWQDRLNNIAQRHPEFADHLRFDDFPSLRRKRNGSGSSSSDQENLRFGGGGSSRFGGLNSRFPSFSHHFEDEFANEPAQNRQEKPPEVPKSQSQEKRGRKPNPNLPQHLSNTVDLGQKQPPVEEFRSQRSMSAPPENRSTQSSRVEHEIPEEQDMGKSQSRQQSQGPSDPPQSQAKERIIPIHVEGRSEPVLPKNTHTPTHANSGPQPEQGFGGKRFGYSQQPFQSAPDPFSQQKRQQAYDQFMPNRQQAGFTKQQTPPFQQAPPQQQQQYYQQQAPQQHYQQQQPGPQQQHYQQQPGPQQQHYPQQAGPQPHYQQQHKQATPPPENRANQQQHRATPPLLNDPLDKIKIVKNDVLELMTHVENFQGTRKDRNYLYLDEMLTRNLIKLDDISTDGKDNIRSARKEAIKCIQTCINNLEAKAQAREKELKAAGIQEQPNEDLNQVADGMLPVLQNPQEQQTLSSVPTFKTEATINLSGPPVESANQHQSSQDQMEIEQNQETSENPADGAAPVQNDAVPSMETETTEKKSDSVQSNSSQLETASK